MFIHNTEL